ncbi:MAG TPA: hypothetical protein DHU55_09395 [Blastocatellia bacterium]|nr:hypothetical protein [Blastocatellia bacterium]
MARKLPKVFSDEKGKSRARGFRLIVIGYRSSAGGPAFAEASAWQAEDRGQNPEDKNSSIHHYLLRGMAGQVRKNL